MRIFQSEHQNKYTHNTLLSETSVLAHTQSYVMTKADTSLKSRPPIGPPRSRDSARCCHFCSVYGCHGNAGGRLSGWDAFYSWPKMTGRCKQCCFFLGGRGEKVGLAIVLLDSRWDREKLDLKGEWVRRNWIFLTTVSVVILPDTMAVFYPITFGISLRLCQK